MSSGFVKYFALMRFLCLAYGSERLFLLITLLTVFMLTWIPLFLRSAQILLFLYVVFSSERFRIWDFTLPVMRGFPVPFILSSSCCKLLFSVSPASWRSWQWACLLSVHLQPSLFPPLLTFLMRLLQGSGNRQAA